MFTHIVLELTIRGGTMMIIILVIAGMVILHIGTAITHGILM